MSYLIVRLMTLFSFINRFFPCTKSCPLILRNFLNHVFDIFECLISWLDLFIFYFHYFQSLSSCATFWVLFSGYCCCCAELSYVWLFATPMDCSPPGSSVHGISQARILEWVAILGDLTPQGLNPRLLHWQADFLPLSHPGMSSNV